MRVSSLLALSLSFGLWLWANVTGQSFANYPEGVTWFFNPLAWQFLFVAGMVACKERQKVRQLLSSAFLFWTSVVIVGLSVIAVAPWTHFEVFRDFRIIPAEWLSVDNKANLSWIRVLHFFALAVLATRLIPPDSKLWKNKLVEIISICGRHALAIFCTGTVLSLFVHIVILVGKIDPISAVLLVISGVFALVLLGIILENAKNRLQMTPQRAKLAA